MCDNYVSGVVTTVSQPVFVGKDFVGVVGVDVTVSDLFTDVIHFARSNSYAFVVNRKDGTALNHPLLPAPMDISSDPVSIVIDVLRPDKAFKPVYRDMMNGLTGNRTILISSIISNGDTQREGISFMDTNLTYLYSPVSNVPFIPPTMMPLLCMFKL